VNPPIVEHVLGQHAVLLDGVAANRLAELLPGHVPLFFKLRIVAHRGLPEPHLLLRVAERLEHEKIRIAMITAIASQQFGQWMFRV
jgi:hypothetical protein